MIPTRRAFDFLPINVGSPFLFRKKKKNQSERLYKLESENLKRRLVTKVFLSENKKKKEKKGKPVWRPSRYKPMISL